MSVPNQWVIKEFIYEPTNKENYYANINLDALYAAMTSKLTLNELKLWLYFSKNNASKYKNVDLSKADCKKWGVGDTQYDTAIKKLIDKGYLVPVNDKKTIYNFVQYPNKPKSSNENSSRKPGCSIQESETDDGSTVIEAFLSSETDQKSQVGNRVVEENSRKPGSGAEKQPETGLIVSETGVEILQNNTPLEEYNNNVSFNPDGLKETYKEAPMSLRGYMNMYKAENYAIKGSDEEWVYVYQHSPSNYWKFKKEENQ